MKYIKLLIGAILLFCCSFVYSQDLNCAHCKESSHDDSPLQNLDLPIGIWNNDSTIALYPIMETKSRRSTLKVHYIDSHFCSSKTMIDLKFSDGSIFILESERNLSCKIVSWINIPDNVNNKFKYCEIESVNIHNISTDHKFKFLIKDNKYFINLYCSFK